MISNDLEYSVTKAQAANFEKALADASSGSTDSVHPMIRQSQIDAIRVQLDELQAEIAAYEEGKPDAVL